MASNKRKRITISEDFEMQEESKEEEEEDKKEQTLLRNKSPGGQLNPNKSQQYEDLPPSYASFAEARSSLPNIANLSSNYRRDSWIGLRNSPSSEDNCGSMDTAAAAALTNVFMNDAIVNFSGRLATHYLNQHKNSSTYHQKLMQQFSEVLSLPPDLEVAKKILVSTMSALYAMMLIVTCLVFTSTEIITKKVPMNFFESRGFYTYLYLTSVIFMLYLFCYVVRFKHKDMQQQGQQQQQQQQQLNESNDVFDVQDFIDRMSRVTGLNVTEIKHNNTSGNNNNNKPRRFSLKEFYPINQYFRALRFTPWISFLYLSIK